MMKYQPTNLNFIPKEDQSSKKDILPKEKPTKVHLTPKFLEETKQEEFSQRKELFRIEEKTMLNNEIDYLREQLFYSENQLTTLEENLHNSNNKIAILEEELKKYQTFTIDVKDDNSGENINTDISKLALENEALKKELKHHKDHVQALYFILLLLVIL